MARMRLHADVDVVNRQVDARIPYRAVLSWLQYSTTVCHVRVEVIIFGKGLVYVPTTHGM